MQKNGVLLLKRNKRYLLVQSAVCVLLALLLIAAVIGVCRGGLTAHEKDPLVWIFSREIVAQAFRPIAPLFFAGVGMAAAGLILGVRDESGLKPVKGGKAEKQDRAEKAASQSASVGFEVGQQLEDFEIVCLDGSTFRLSDTRGKVVFLNLWATYCTPCVQELPHFDALYREHADDIAMLAVHSSVVTDDPAGYLADKGWSLPFAVDTEDDMVWKIVNGSSTLPQTIVLDRYGVVIYNQKGSVTPEVLSALYEQAVGGELSAPAAQTAAAETAENAYTVRVNDEAENPVPGVTVQFCSDVECMTGQTDENGEARFEREAGVYTIHLLKVPAGYAPDDTEYAAPEKPGTVTLVLKADGSAAEEEHPSVIDEPRIGLHMEVPESILGMKGMFAPNASFPASDLLRIEFEYYAVAQERWDEYNDYGVAYIEAMEKDEDPPEPPEPFWMSGREHACAFAIFGIHSGGEDELRALLQEWNAPYDDNLTWLELIWTDGNTSFYAGQYQRTEDRMDQYREKMGKYFDEFEAFYRDKETFLASLTMSSPSWPSDLSVGSVIRFETTDLDGNPVSTEELFAEGKVTMINIWGTWCGPCRRELPELAVMAKEFEAQGCRIVGICNDAYDAEKAELAKTFLAEAGAEYLCLVGSPELDQYFCVLGFPSTFFVDSEGHLLFDPIVGAFVEAWLCRDCRKIVMDC